VDDTKEKGEWGSVKRKGRKWEIGRRQGKSNRAGRGMGKRI
jgi:hypothetical protein